MTIKQISSGGGEFTLAVPASASNRTITLPDKTCTLQENVGQSMVRVDTTNGYGSTNTAVRRWTTVSVNQGSDITYADSAANGGSFTVNTNGVYAITYVDQFNAAAAPCVVTVNKTTLSGGADTLTGGSSSAANVLTNMSWTGYLSAGSVIRAVAGTPSGTSTTYPSFTITRVA